MGHGRHTARRRTRQIALCRPFVDITAEEMLMRRVSTSGSRPPDLACAPPASGKSPKKLFDAGLRARRSSFIKRAAFHAHGSLAAAPTPAALIFSSTIDRWRGITHFSHA